VAGDPEGLHRDTLDDGHEDPPFPMRRRRPLRRSVAATKSRNLSLRRMRVVGDMIDSLYSVDVLFASVVVTGETHL
jgi:hypothetical protein